MILVTGSSGKTGMAVTTALATRGARVRALIRRPDRHSALVAAGAAETAIGSFDHPDSLLAAADGIAAIYHICPNVSPNEFAYAQTVAAAAKARGVKRFVFHSVLHPQIEAMPHHWRKLRVEEMLFTAGFELTVLQPTAYMQNILGAWRGISQDGVFRIPYPAATRLCLVDLDDLAEAAALVLTTDGHAGATYEVVGTAALSQSDVAATIGAALGKTVRVEVETVEAWEARAGVAGMGAHERTTLAAMFRYYAEHGLVGNPNVLRWLLGREPTDLTGFMARAKPG